MPNSAHRMARWISVAVILCAVRAVAGSDVTAWRHDAETHCMTGGIDSATLDDLMFHASRYGDTAEKQARKKDAYAELEARGSEAFAYLVANVHRENMWFYLYARRMLNRLPMQDVVEVLVEHLDNPEPRVRKIATFFLGFCDPDDDAVMPVRAMLSDKDAAGAAIRTLGKWRSSDCVPDLTPFLSHTNEARRIQAAIALGEIGDTQPATVDALVRAIGDPVFTARNAAAKALVAMGETEDAVGQHLLAAFPGLPWRAKRQAVRVFGDLGFVPAVPVLQQWADSDDPCMARDARCALGRIDDTGEGEDTRVLHPTAD